MSHSGWSRHDDEDVAIDKLLDAAGEAFATHGVAKATMTDIARVAGCSRATLYRYFPNQDELYLGFVHRASLRIAAQLAEQDGPRGTRTLTDRILAGIAAVRDDPLLAIWFEPENMAVPIKMSQSSDLLRAMSAGLVDQNSATPRCPEEVDRRGEWLLRSIISLLAMPGDDTDAERAMIDTFVIPVVTTPIDPQGSRQ